jgi:hypothetical protein
VRCIILPPEGDRKENIFTEEDDRLIWLEVFEVVCNRYSRSHAPAWECIQSLTNGVEATIKIIHPDQPLLL